MSCDAERGSRDKVIKIATHFADGSVEEWTGEAARVFHKEAWWYLGETGSLADYEPTIVPPKQDT